MRKTIYLLCVAALAGCAGQATVPTGTPEDQAAICIHAITTTRKAATALLRAGRITLEKDRTIQDSLNAAVPGCRAMVEQGVAP